MSDPGKRDSGKKAYPLLGAAAYLLVPGERRKKAAGHFKKAGFEAAKGLGALWKPEKPPDENASSERQKIEVK